MSYNIELSVKARRELLETRKWYEEKQPGLGKRFTHGLFRKLHLIEGNPLQYPLKKRFREARIDIFPCLIVYKIIKANNTVIIISIFT